MTKYVIERMEGTTRQWWTGDDWSDMETEALWFVDLVTAEEHSIDNCGGTVTGFEI